MLSVKSIFLSAAIKHATIGRAAICTETESVADVRAPPLVAKAQAARFFSLVEPAGGRIRPALECQGVVPQVQDT